LVDLAEHNPALKRALSDYREVVKAHSRAVEAAWAEHHHLLERASCAGLRAAAKAHNDGPTWQGLGVLQRSALVINARRRPPRSVRPRTARTTPRIRRAAARRAAGIRAGADPPGEDPERPPPRGELRHISNARADYLEELRLEGGRL
jgi:hypothetical protein